MTKCSFCTKQIEIGRGTIFVLPDKVLNFCSSKCMKNWQIGRDGKKLAWVKKSLKGKGQEELKEELLEEAKESVKEKEIDKAKIWEEVKREKEAREKVEAEKVSDAKKAEGQKEVEKALREEKQEG